MNTTRNTLSENRVSKNFGATKGKKGKIRIAEVLSPAGLRPYDC